MERFTQPEETDDKISTEVSELVIATCGEYFGLELVAEQFINLIKMSDKS